MTHSHFYNPYNFIPAPPRNAKHPELGDHAPTRQDMFLEERYSGRICVTMEVITPLIIPDPEKCEETSDGHKTYEILKDRAGNPLVPSSSVRGMLRSAYEVVTNSRFGCFSADLRRRLAFRMDASQALNLIPARVEGGKIHLLPGTSRIGQNGRPIGPMYAAWLPRYGSPNKSTSAAVKYPNGILPKHGDMVKCHIKLTSKGPYSFWRVVSIEPTNSIAYKGDPCSGSMVITGWVCINNPNTNKKHDERVFFSYSSSSPNTTPGPFKIDQRLKCLWDELITNYQELHERDLEKRKKQGNRCDQYLGPKPGQTAWSRHICGGKKERELNEGTLCYVRLSPNHQHIEAVFPVMISRELYQCSPFELLDASLRPAASIKELSPADRVFGWVLTHANSGSPHDSKQSADVNVPEAGAVASFPDYETHAEERIAARGLLQVGPVACQSSIHAPISRFNAMPLAILSSPKPQYARFYVAQSPHGEAQKDKLSRKDAGYSKGKGLRGRKVYPHHKDKDSRYWNPENQNTEFRRIKDIRDDQNCSITEWINPGTKFLFDIHVLNISEVELGALLWLLSLPENHYFRLGHGKPLGFGSVRLMMKRACIYDNDQLKEMYKQWGLFCPILSKEEIGAFVDKFKNAVKEAYYTRFDDVTFIKSFFQSCQGLGARNCPVHYPRLMPQPVDETFNWFVENERGDKRSLPHLTQDPRLPLNPNSHAG
ncbi:MAG: TIGR03986 family CRISPR-associated RAMP protein [Candidatus Sumerlaeaceae bacterium]|nr:TIGR03986 family CRISPR-associated RAMP protein [Candidatus Sumerlaeaceae bacterium]